MEGRRSTGDFNPAREERGGLQPQRREAGPRGEEGKDIDRSPHCHTGARARGFVSPPRRPPWRPGSPPTHASPEGGGAGRAPQTHLGQTEPTDRRRQQPLASLFDLAGQLSSRTQPPDTTRKTPRHGRGGRDALRTTASPACRAARPPRRPGDRPPGPCVPGRPPYGGSGSTAAERPDEARGR